MLHLVVPDWTLPTVPHHFLSHHTSEWPPFPNANILPLHCIWWRFSPLALVLLCRCGEMLIHLKVKSESLKSLTWPVHIALGRAVCGPAWRMCEEREIWYQSVRLGTEIKCILLLHFYSFQHCLVCSHQIQNFCASKCEKQTNSDI